MLHVHCVLPCCNTQQFCKENTPGGPRLMVLYEPQTNKSTIKGSIYIHDTGTAGT